MIKELESWLKKEKFNPKKSYIITVGNDKHPADQKDIQEITDELKNIRWLKGHFLIVSHNIKFIRLKEVK